MTDESSAPDGPDAWVPDDPLSRLVALRLSTERRLQALRDATGGARAPAWRRLQLALRQRWKLDEQAVAPRLDGSAADSSLSMLERESTLLQELADLVDGGTLPPAVSATLAGTLSAMSALRAERLEAALAAALDAGRVDADELARDIDQRLARWRGEVLATGDIEDEEIDPVGTPPR